MAAPDALLVVFARAVAPGRVKTRLIPAVGAAGAAALHLAFVDDVCARTRGLAARRLLAVAGAGAPGIDVPGVPDHPVNISRTSATIAAEVDLAGTGVAATELAGAGRAWPDGEGIGPLGRIAAREGMAMAAQAEGDLGARLDAAITSGLRAGAPVVVVVGGDAPLLPRDGVARAIARLAAGPRGPEVVIGPAEDGGYWLIGARRPAPFLFDRMCWGTAAVREETERRLRARAVRYELVGRGFDVDEPADLARLTRELARDPEAAPATRVALGALSSRGGGGPAR